MPAMVVILAPVCGVVLGCVVGPDMVAASSVASVWALRAGGVKGAAARSAGLERAPVLEPLGDQLAAFWIVESVEDTHVLWIGAPVHPGGARVQSRILFRTSRPVSGRALGRLQPDLPGPVQVVRVRVERPFSVPVLEDARREMRGLSICASILDGPTTGSRWADSAGPVLVRRYFSRDRYPAGHAEHAEH